MKDNKIPVSQEIKKHLLTGISWMIPLIVAAGISVSYTHLTLPTKA